MATEKKYFVRGTEVRSSTLPRDHVEFRHAGFVEAKDEDHARKLVEAAQAAAQPTDDPKAAPAPEKAPKRPARTDES